MKNHHLSSHNSHHPYSIVASLSTNSFWLHGTSEYYESNKNHNLYRKGYWIKMMFDNDAPKKINSSSPGNWQQHDIIPLLLLTYTMHLTIRIVVALCHIETLSPIRIVIPAVSFAHACLPSPLPSAHIVHSNVEASSMVTRCHQIH